MSNTARKARIEVVYQGVNITETVSASLKSFVLNDNVAYTADDVSMELEDRELKWLKSWWPERSDCFTIKMKTENWMKAGSQTLELGTFLLDEPSYSGPPHQITLSGVSIPADSNFSETARDKAWEKSDIKAIAQEIAGRYNMKLLFDSQVNPIIERLDQNKVSDMQFLNTLCQKYGLALKVTSKAIIIFDFASYEAKQPVLTIDRAGGMVESFSIQTATGYTACKVSSSSSDNKTISAVFQDPAKRGQKEKLLEVSEDVRNRTEAEYVAKARLREENKKEAQISLTMVGNLNIAAGMTVGLSNFGKFDGTYLIEKARYQFSPFTMTLELYRVMGW